MLEKHNSECPSGIRDIVLEILAYAVGAHHGLFDCVDDNSNNGFTKRVQKDDIDYDKALTEFFNSCSNEQEINDLLEQAENELLPIFNTIESLAENNANDIYNTQLTFYTGFLTRLILSAIIEADRSDTARFMNGTSEIMERNMPEVWQSCIKMLKKSWAI